MTRSPTVFRVGTRPSSLALTQTRTALDRMESLLDGVAFEMVPITSIGDTDRSTDLRESPADFFTRELDDQLLEGGIDLAIHSAKDLPDPVPDGIDWFWLPWREEPRDVLVLAEGRTLSDLPADPVVGVSSDRRAEYCARRFPGAVQRNIRGNIGERIDQVDRGDFDVVIMAAAALIRLGLAARISEWIPLKELEVPAGQGYLAVTFRKGDERMTALRSLFVPAVVLAGAGVSNRELCTLATLQALRRCDICLYDSLIDDSLLEELPAHAETIDVGKRCGAHSREQHETTRLLCECARKSLHVVRLKGGDPGIFGRLAEEAGALEELGIPFRVIPGISALQAATTGTGMLLTRRDVSRGFVALTPRMQGGGLARCDSEMKNRLPVIYYMSIKAIDPVARQLLEDGRSADTPAALVFNAGGSDERIIRTRLGDLPQLAEEETFRQPGLIIVGEIAHYSYKTDLGAHRGRTVLLTCSSAIQPKAVELVRDFGGHPVSFPLIRLVSRPGFRLRGEQYDWLVVTSPSSVRAFMEHIQSHKVDFRSLPKIMVCGRGTADAFAGYGIHVDLQPEQDFSADALRELAGRHIGSGQKVLRVRSDKAGPDLAEALRKTGADVEDAVIYDNVPVTYDALPGFDAVFFASSSAVESFIRQWGAEALAGKTTVVIGLPTARALEACGLRADVLARESTVKGAINALAAHYVGEKLCSRKPD